jgi:hypothetical protein
MRDRSDRPNEIPNLQLGCDETPRPDRKDQALPRYRYQGGWPSEKLSGERQGDGTIVAATRRWRYHPERLEQVVTYYKTGENH